MNRSIVYRRCVTLLDILKQNGFENEISLPELKKTIAKNIGANRETVRRYLEYLQTFAMIYPTVKPNVLRMNHDYEGIEKKVVEALRLGTLDEW